MDKNWNEFCKKFLEKVIEQDENDNNIDWSFEYDHKFVIIGGKTRTKNNDIMVITEDYLNSNLSEEELMNKIFNHIRENLYL